MRSDQQASHNHRQKCPLLRILAWSDSHIANGLIESINSLVQAAKAKARGYRSLCNLVAITYLIAGKIGLTLPTRNSGEPTIFTGGFRRTSLLPSTTIPQDAKTRGWSQLTADLPARA